MFFSSGGPVGISFGPGMVYMPFGHGSVGSDCGDEFDDYVRRVEEPFPYSPMRPAAREAHFWKGRRCHLYRDATTKREAKVVSWCQRNTGPFSRETQWQLSVQFEGSMEKGDTVKIAKLPKAHDGKTGQVVQVLANAKVKVQLDDDPLQQISVQADHAQPTPQIFSVHRMNVRGGGTLDNKIGFASNRIEFVSLEWIDAASPPPTTKPQHPASCPTCRAEEPPLMAYDDSVCTSTTALCPICTETKPCRTLSVCQHQFCTDCWSQWRNRSTKIPHEVHAPILSDRGLQKERDRNFQRVRILLPPNRGGTVNRTRSSGGERAKYKFRTHVGRILAQLDEDAHSGPQGLEQYWNTLSTMAIQLFGLPDAMKELVTELQSIAACEILIRVLQERQEQIQSIFPVLFPSDSSEDGWTEHAFFPVSVVTTDTPENYVQLLYLWACARIGELLEENHQYREATPFYERAVLHARKRVETMKHNEPLDNDNNYKDTLGSMYNNLGLAQKRAGLYKEALENYNKGIETLERPETLGNKKMLLEEIQQWTGSSGKLTPTSGP